MVTFSADKWKHFRCVWKRKICVQICINKMTINSRARILVHFLCSILLAINVFVFLVEPLKLVSKLARPHQLCGLCVDQMARVETRKRQVHFMFTWEWNSWGLSSKFCETQHGLDHDSGLLYWSRKCGPKMNIQQPCSGANFLVLLGGGLFDVVCGAGQKSLSAGHSDTRQLKAACCWTASQ